MRHEAFTLSAANGRRPQIPPGFAHGVQTPADDAEWTNPIPAPCTPSAGGGLPHDGPLVGIAWPMQKAGAAPILRYRSPDMAA